jgi:ubiquinone/menaquinone biosynthesis C-methylase UbiE
MMPRFLRILTLATREAFSAQHLERRPEPAAAMEDLQSVEAFHAEGATTGGLLPTYHFNALATSRLIPEGGTLVDLGSGSGQYLSHLAQCRPDIRIIGVDLSETMVMVGNRALAEAGYKDRIELRVGDMTNFRHLIPKQVDVISCVFALHHLPTATDMRRCLQEIAYVREKTGCGVWIFDNARPRHPRTAEEYPEVFTPKASPAFYLDSRNSQMAAWSFAELSAFLDEASIGAFRHVCSSIVRLFQAHWLEQQSNEMASGKAGWVRKTLSPVALGDFRQLRWIFWAVPLS